MRPLRILRQFTALQEAVFCPGLPQAAARATAEAPRLGNPLLCLEPIDATLVVPPLLVLEAVMEAYPG